MPDGMPRRRARTRFRYRRRAHGYSLRDLARPARTASGGTEKPGRAGGKDHLAERIMPTATAVKKRMVRINGCVAAAQAAKYADVDVIAAYPIRPYTATMMALAQMVANGELDAEYIVADSEHSQLSIAHGAASAGARVFTGSSGVGVQFAYELYSPISGSRMPVQMMIADRT